MNALLVPLLDPKVPDSAYRFATVPVPGEAIRQIPFKIGKEGATFSMDRLMARGEWPVTLRGEAFARERKAYGEAVDIALDQMVQERLSRSAVEAVRAAVKDLQNRLDKVAPSRREHDDLYLRAKNYLDELAEVGRMLAIPAVEHVLGAIERYHGTTAGDLLKFMHDQDVRFGVAKTDVERDLYRQLYAALLQQSDVFAASRQVAHGQGRTPRQRRKRRAARPMTFVEIFSSRGDNQRGGAGLGIGVLAGGRQGGLEPLEPFPGGGVGAEVVRDVLGLGIRLGPRRVMAVREVPLGGVVLVFPEERQALAPRAVELDELSQGLLIGLEFLVLCVAHGDLAVELVRRAGDRPPLRLVPAPLSFGLRHEAVQGMLPFEVGHLVGEDELELLLAGDQGEESPRQVNVAARV